jgi:hypothetical protein
VKDLKSWIAKHKAAAIVLGIVVLWIGYRLVKGMSLTSGRHANPQDAISYGWSVYQAGITGWLEVSPDGKSQYMHDTGWTSDPYGQA